MTPTVCEHVITQHACRCVCNYTKTSKWSRKRVGTLVCSMPAVLMLMDVLAWSTRSNKERKVIFFHTGVGVRQQRQEGAGLCTPPHSSHVIYLIVFSHPAHSPAGAGTAQKDWHTVKIQNLASSQGSATFDELWLNNKITCLTCRCRYRHALVPASDCTEVWLSC